jgi:fatty-acyl-CoA synthase/long-chain acyl-CoA synthetase
MMRGATYRARVRLATREHDVTWGAGPLFHVGSLAPFIGSLGAVGTYLTDYFFEPGRALDLMVAEGVTIAWPWFPAIMQPLIDHPRFDPAALPDLRSLFLIGPRSLIEQVQAMFPKAELVAACGMTETAGIYALSTPDETVEERAGAQGKAAAGVEVRVIHPETGDDLPAGEIGEILVRGYCVMEGYYRDPVNTEKAIDADRWLHTGDLYSVTPDGRLVFHGRVKDMLKVGGENVAVIEVESFLCRHPDVNLAEVVGMPDDRLDEVPVAFVELRAGSTTEAEELIDFCRGQIASYKVPRRIFFVGPDEWPMSLTKIDKRRLRARVADALAVR